MAVKKGMIHQESLRDVSRNDGFGFSSLKLFCMGIVYRFYSNALKPKRHNTATG